MSKQKTALDELMDFIEEGKFEFFQIFLIKQKNLNTLNKNKLLKLLNMVRTLNTLKKGLTTTTKIMISITLMNISILLLTAILSKVTYNVRVLGEEADKQA